MKMRQIGRKSQEEMVGFVLIIVLVAVIGIIFLSLSIKKTSTQVSSSEVNSFLYSIMPYTTDCRQVEFLSFRELVVKCYENQDCDNQAKACDILDDTAKMLIDSAFPTGNETKYKAHAFRIHKNNETIYSAGIEQAGNYVSGEVPIYSVGSNAYVRLELYY